MSETLDSRLCGPFEVRDLSESSDNAMTGKGKSPLSFSGVSLLSGGRGKKSLRGITVTLSQVVHPPSSPFAVLENLGKEQIGSPEDATLSSLNN